MSYDVLIFSYALKILKSLNLHVFLICKCLIIYKNDDFFVSVG